MGAISDDGIFDSNDKSGYVSLFVKDITIPNNTAEGTIKIVYPSVIDLVSCLIINNYTIGHKWCEW